MGIYKLNVRSRILNQLEEEQDLDFKITEFCLAMEQYKNNPVYVRVQLMVSVLIMFFQAVTLLNLCKAYNGASFIVILIAFILAYIISDFVNGFIHMYMDNNTHYASRAGPFIASFHLHHAKLKYTYRHPIKIYFYESGTKFWLLAYLLVVVFLQKYVALPYGINVCLVSIAILSSFAELSHYWCHNATKKNKIILVLQKYRLLLSKQNHMDHHRSDNTHYAFLNGITNPLLNKISRCCYEGYKNNADKHTSAYFLGIARKHMKKAPFA